MEKIAIVGLGCLFPGAKTPDEFWRIVQEGIDVSSPLSEAELGADPARYFHPEKGRVDKINYNRNGYIRDFTPDLSGYRIAESKLQKLDKLFHWTLFSAHQALQDAGYANPQDHAEKCGLVLGNINMPTHAVKHLAAPYYRQAISPLVSELIGADFQLGPYWQDKDWSDDNMLIGSHSVGIAAQALGLTGPTFGLDAACSSAIYAIELARQYLLAGHADLMLAGATCHVDHIVINHGFNILQAYPDAASGESRPFSRDSKGLKGGEGAGVVALKRLGDAQRDGDSIYAVIETIGLSNDAGAKHVLVPDETGQKLAMQRAYAARRLPVDYIECHATGTEVGDGVELNSIAHFFADQPALPKVGANKSNFGHMLTAASMASIFKVILAMRYGQIPATIGVTDFIGSADKSLNENHLVSTLTAWPTRDGAAQKYGAVNAFGFGGVNAHLCLSTAFDGQAPAIQDSPKLAAEALAIVGMSVNIPGQVGLRGFDRMVQQGKQPFTALPATRWCGVEQNPSLLAEFGLHEAPRGAYAEHFAFDCRRYKIPPNVAGLHLLSHLSMLPMAERAFIDAGYPLDGKPRNIAVIISGDSDLNSLRYQARIEMAWQIRDSLAQQQLTLSEEEISELETIVKDAIFPEPHVEGITGGISNMVASRISAHLKLNGPAFTVQSHENSALVALQVAQVLIRGGHVEAAIVGAGSFSGSAENVLFNHRRNPLSCDQNGLPLQDSSGWQVGEGGGIVVVKPAGKTTAKDRVYATIRALDIIKCPNGQPDAESVRQAAQQALHDASLSADQIDYLEVHASGIPGEDQAERAGLAEAYQSRQQAPLATGSVKTNIGHTHGASAIIGLIKTALCLYGRYQPASANAAGQDHTLDKRFVLRGKTRHQPDMRYAALNSLGLDQNYAHVVLQAAGPVDREPLDSKTLDWEQNYRKGLLKDIWVSGERTYRQHILDAKNLARFADVRTRLQALKPSVEAKAPLVARTQPSGPTLRPVRSLESAFPPAAASNETAQRRTQFARNVQTHHAYLATQQAMLVRLRTLLQQTGDTTAQPIQQTPADPAPVSDPISVPAPIPAPGVRPAPEPIPFAISPRSANALFNEAQLREMTDGKIANVLGEKYAVADQYPIRTRMPSLPFNFVSRITRLTAEYGMLKPCTIEWEYDIPKDAWYLAGFMLPSFISLEASHAMIVAYTVIGCDEMFKGELGYRAVNSSTRIYSDFPMAGEILRGQVDITSIKRMRSNVLIDYTYRCYVGDRLCFELKASSGFFNRADINEAKGMNTKSAFARAEKQPKPGLLDFVTRKTAFAEKEIAAFGQGLFSQCFEPAYQDIPMPVFRPSTQMLDRITHIQADGGAWGLGQALGEVDIDPGHWAFDAHFKNDPCLPGTLIVEGCEQMMKFYIAYLGISSLPYLRHRWSHDILSTAKFRGEVKRRPATLTYRYTVKAFDMQKNADRVQSLFLNALVEILYEGKTICLCDDMSVVYEAVDQAQHEKEKEMYMAYAGEQRV